MSRIKHTVLIDDNKTTNFLNQYLMLKSKRFQRIDTYTNGNKVLQKFVDDPTFEPDIIFLDLDMPDINGWQILEAFEKQLAAKVKTKIFILTSTINAEHHRRFIPKPFAPEYLIKPLDQKIIEALLQKYFPETSSYIKKINENLNPNDSINLI